VHGQESVQAGMSQHGQPALVADTLLSGPSYPPGRRLRPVAGGYTLCEALSRTSIWSRAYKGCFCVCARQDIAVWSVK
jgi:hypothetical protein